MSSIENQTHTGLRPRQISGCPFFPIGQDGQDITFDHFDLISRCLDELFLYLDLTSSYKTSGLAGDLNEIPVFVERVYQIISGKYT